MIATIILIIILVLQASAKRVYMFAALRLSVKAFTRFKIALYVLMIVLGFMLGIFVPLYNLIDQIIFLVGLFVIASFYLHNAIYRTLLRLYMNYLDDRPGQVRIANPADLRWLIDALKDRPGVRIVYGEDDREELR